GRRAAAAVGKGRGGKPGKKRLDIGAPVFSPRAAAGAAASTARSSDGVADTKHDENDSAPEVVGAGPHGGGAGAAGAAAGATAAPGTAEAAAVAAAGKGGEAVGIVDRCKACSETEERCDRLEERVAELSLAQGKAAAAAAAASADAAKAREVAEGSRRDVGAAVAASMEKAASLDLSRRQQKTLAPAAATAEGGGRWASKASVEKLTGELRQLLKRVKDGADALALVDYAVKDIRDEIAPLSGTVSALKRLVETQLREKGQAAELLKGYVTTITREASAT
ncbi:unnamed protein product, partial [Hapterophycus canaliculatus]